MVESSNNDRYLSMKEICEYLGIQRFTALKWINERNMPAYKVGNLWKFKIDEIDAWVKSGSVNSK